MQFDLWWEVYGRSSMKTWCAGSFVLSLVLTLFGLDPFGSMNMLIAAGLSLAAAAVLTSRPRVRAVTTVLYGAYLAAYLWTFVPRRY